MKRNKGFTLIELLVVIAIIGILSAIVLASLNSARNRATDAKVQGQLSSMRTAAEIYYSEHSDYGTPVTKTTISSGSSFSGIWTDVDSGMNALASSTAASAADKKLTIVSSVATGGSVNAVSWAAAAKLSTNAWFCADSTGKAATQTADISTTACN